MALSYHSPALVNTPQLRLVTDEEGVPDDGQPATVHFFVIPSAVMDEYAPRVGATAWAVFTVLVRHADTAGRCFPSHDHIAKALGIKGRQTVMAALAKLAKEGMIRSLQRQTASDARTSNEYEILIPMHVRKLDTPLSDNRTAPVQKTDSPCTKIVHEVDTDEVDTDEVPGDTPPTPRKRSEYPVDFEERFWPRYPGGRGTKKKAADQWRQLPPGDRSAAVAGLDKWLASDQWSREGGRFIVYAERYLRDRVWENDPPPPVPTGRNGFHDPGRVTLTELLADIAEKERRGES